MSRVRPPGGWLLAISRGIFDDAVRGRVVDQTIADMRAEWTAATNVGRRVRARWLGYIAFWSLVLMAPFVFRSSVSWRFDMRRVTQMWMTAFLVSAGIIGGYVVSRVKPALYRASATIQVLPPSVSAAVAADVDTSNPGSFGDRIQVMTQLVLSRTRLQRMVEEFNLLGADRGAISDEALDLIRRHVSFTALRSSQIRIEYTGADPVTVMEVTKRFTSSLIEESLKDVQRRAESTLSFVNAQVADMEAKLNVLMAEVERAGQRGAVSQARRLEVEVTENLYRNLLARRAQADMKVALERRQLGEQLVVLESARVPQEPIGPTRAQLTLMGGLTGLATAIVIMLGAWLRRAITSPRRAAPATA